MGYDPVRGKIILVGGDTSPDVLTLGDDCKEGTAQLCGYTWEWDGSFWRIAATGGPSSRTGARFAFDVRHGVLVLFGGYAPTGCGEGSGAFCGYTWGFDGTSWRVLSKVGPTPRYNHVMAWDPTRQAVIMQGGRVLYGDCLEGAAESDLCTKTWQWAGSDWSELVVGQALPGRERHAMIFDEAAGTPVVYGGRGDTPCTPSPATQQCGETWRLEDGGWVIDDTITPLTFRWYPAMDFDPQQGAPLMFGGMGSGTCDGGTSAQCGALFELDGSGWSSIFDTEQANAPAPRHGASLIYDWARGETVLFGGANPGGCGELETTTCRNVWRWDGDSFKVALAVRQIPDPYFSIALAYSPAHSALVLVGSNAGSSLDTWKLVNNRWVSVATGAPTDRFEHAMAYDRSAGDLVLFGGAYVDYSSLPPVTAYRNDTWTLSGSTWTLRTPTTSPAARFGHEIVAAGSHGVIMYGGNNGSVCEAGSYCQLLWCWTDGSPGTWSNCGNTTVPRSHHAMAYDPDLDALVVFGGQFDPPGPGPLTIYHDTWMYSFADGSVTELASDGPAGSIDASMAYDPASGRLLLIEGREDLSGDATGGTWTWNGTTWVADDPSSLPARFNTGLAYDPRTARLTVYGGNVVAGQLLPGNYLRDTWTREFRPNQRPGHLFTVDLEAVGLGANIAVRDVELTWLVGATHEAEDGAEVSLWAGDHWHSLAANAAAAGAPNQLTTSVSDPGLLASALDGPRRKLTFMARPASTGTGGVSTVAADYVEAAVHYRRP